VQPEFLKSSRSQLNGAGALYDFGCYGVDLATWLQHGEAPLTVTAVTQQLKPDKYPHVDDEGTIILAYPHAQPIIQGSWNWPSTQGHGGLRRHRLADDIKSDKVLERTQGEKVATERRSHAAGAARGWLFGLSDRSANGQLKPQGDLTALDTNVTVMQILDAARTSAKTGRTVKLTPLQNSSHF